NVCTCLLPQLEGFRIVAELDANLFQHRVGIRLDQCQPLLIEDFVERNLALDVRQLRTRAAAGTRRAPRSRTAASPAPAGVLLYSRIVFHARFPDSTRLRSNRSQAARDKRPASARACRNFDNRENYRITEIAIGRFPLARRRKSDKQTASGNIRIGRNSRRAAMRAMSSGAWECPT